MLLSLDLVLLAWGKAFGLWGLISPAPFRIRYTAASETNLPSRSTRLAAISLGLRAGCSRASPPHTGAPHPLVCSRPSWALEQVLQPSQSLVSVSALPPIVGGRGHLQLLESLAHRQGRMLHQQENFGLDPRPLYVHKADPWVLTQAFFQRQVLQEQLGPQFLRHWFSCLRVSTSARLASLRVSLLSRPLPASMKPVLSVVEGSLSHL
jgi:hypothetical protein